jgi:zinc protease
MPKFLRACLFLLASAVAYAALPFAHEASDLTPDPTARFGTLPNGIRYVVRPNAEPKGRAALRFVVLAGSFMETDQQRGLAHFLEHMSFNGSAHYPPGTLVEFFQRLGMNFGGDTNAYTSFDRTVYKIDLPDTKPETIAEGLRVFSDYAGGLLLDAKEIDRERGVILAERRARDSVQYRTMIAELDFVLAGTRLPARLPIGTEDVISHAARDAFLDFYNTWYRPERIAVVAVGDFDTVAVEKAIVAALTPITDRAKARPDPDLGHLAQPQGLRVQYHHEIEAPSTQVSLSTVTPFAYEPDTKANRLKRLPRELALSMLNQRLAILAKKEGAPFTNAHGSIHESYDFYREASLDVTCQPGQWSAALNMAEQELRRATTHGFQPAELKEAAARFSNAIEQAVQTASTRQSTARADEIVDRIVGKKVFTPPEEERDLLQPALATVTPETCAAALREAWAAPHRYLLVSGNAQIDGDATAAITAAYEKSQAVAVAAPEKIADDSFAYLDFGPAGKVTRSEKVADLDVTLVEFANGVRLNLKKTDFEANRIRIHVRVGTGQLIEPHDQPGLATLAGNTFLAGGLGRHSTDNLGRIFAGKTIHIGFRVMPDASVFNAETNREYLLLQLQLVAAYLTDPGYRPEALRQARKNIDDLYNRLDHTPSGPLQTEVPRLLAGGDSRIGQPPRDVILRRTLDEVKSWLAPQLAHGPIEIAIVGDLDVDATIATVARTLGALPPRESRPSLANERKLNLPAEPLTKEYRIDTKIPKGMVALYWPTTDFRDVSRMRRLAMLGQILQDRLRVKIRQELGEAYSPVAANHSSETYTDYGFMFAHVTVDPAQAQRVADAILAIADDLNKNGVTEDELTRAKQPVLTALRQSARTNQYWAEVVLRWAQEMPESLVWCRSRYADVEAITKADLDALARTYLAPTRASRVLVLPEVKPEPRA